MGITLINNESLKGFPKGQRVLKDTASHKASTFRYTASHIVPLWYKLRVTMSNEQLLDCSLFTVHCFKLPRPVKTNQSQFLSQQSAPPARRDRVAKRFPN